MYFSLVNYFSANIVQLLHLGDSLWNGVMDKDSSLLVTREATRAVICADNVYRSLWVSG